MTFKVKKNDARQTAKPQITASNSFDYYDSITLSFGKLKLTGTDSISKKTLLNTDSLHIYKPGSIFSITWFAMTFVIDSKLHVCHSNGGSLTACMREKIADSKPGSTILLKDISYNRLSAVPDVSNETRTIARSFPYSIYITE